jgi:hypothetical protein
MALRFSVQQLVLACLVGLGVGFGAYLFTAMNSQDQVISFCDPGQSAGFDPWTGLPHGATFNCPQLHPDGTQTSFIQSVAMPADLASRRAIPVPLGFAVGAGLVLLGVRVSERRTQSG